MHLCESIQKMNIIAVYLSKIKQTNANQTMWIYLNTKNGFFIAIINFQNYFMNIILFRLNHQCTIPNICKQHLLLGEGLQKLRQLIINTTVSNKQ